MSRRIYFLQADDGTGPIKIGRSGKPLSRLANVQVWSPVRLKMLADVASDRFAERYLHDQFAGSRLHGEWFAPTRELLDLIGRIQLGEIAAITPGIFRVVRLGRKKPHLPIDEIAVRYAAGLKVAELASIYGVKSHEVYRVLRASPDIVLKRGRPAGNGPGMLDIARANRFLQQREAGRTLKSIGDEAGISRERVRQILCRSCAAPSVSAAA